LPIDILEDQQVNNAFKATNIATTETANIERFDVLKRPAAMLYGQGEPGGVINYITNHNYPASCAVQFPGRSGAG
jgi:outer membrane receptor protein involved in Fe transport